MPMSHVGGFRGDVPRVAAVSRRHRSAQSRSGMQSRCPRSSSQMAACARRRTRTATGSPTRSGCHFCPALSCHADIVVCASDLRLTYAPNAQRPPAFGPAGVWFRGQALSYLSCCVGLVLCGAPEGFEFTATVGRTQKQPGLGRAVLIWLRGQDLNL